jgi:hypothetical protein
MEKTGDPHDWTSGLSRSDPRTDRPVDWRGRRSNIHQMKPLMAGVLAGLFCFATNAAAQSRDDGGPATLAFKIAPGAICWRYNGTVRPIFLGNLLAKQLVIASAAGESFFHRNGSTVVEVAPWSLNVRGPNGFSKSDNPETPGRLEFVAPQSGEYAFSVGPTAIWGNRGMFAVCAH